MQEAQVHSQIHIGCPCCRNRRLFDADPETTEGIITIKCPSCRALIAISFHMKKMNTKRLDRKKN